MTLQDKLTAIVVAWENSAASASDFAVILSRIASDDSAKDWLLNADDEFIRSGLFETDDNCDLIRDPETVMDAPWMVIGGQNNWVNGSFEVRRIWRQIRNDQISPMCGTSDAEGCKEE